ncbi:hypothetical protein TNCT_718821 [Trichonephila clavata]|uniref:Uncharacterized protein n=1 Tax=Trichonephila clavata TaxID=2740835 RepID=A0A8X6F8V4_TRICU|nr:hypothetical protein TNCT_718821 [Trichonephila clavata]
MEEAKRQCNKKVTLPTSSIKRRSLIPGLIGINLGGEIINARPKLSAPSSTIPRISMLKRGGGKKARENQDNKSRQNPRQGFQPRFKPSHPLKKGTPEIKCWRFLCSRWQLSKQDLGNDSRKVQEE